MSLIDGLGVAGSVARVFATTGRKVGASAFVLRVCVFAAPVSAFIRINREPSSFRGVWSLKRECGRDGCANVVADGDRSRGLGVFVSCRF